MDYGFPLNKVGLDPFNARFRRSKTPIQELFSMTARTVSARSVALALITGCPPTRSDRRGMTMDAGGCFVDSDCPDSQLFLL